MLPVRVVTLVVQNVPSRRSAHKRILMAMGSEKQYWSDKIITPEMFTWEKEKPATYPSPKPGHDSGPE
jgi:hypothetical protein